jgi:hypothetical protein
MGQPRADGEVVPAFVPPDPEWLGRLLGEFVKRIHTPAPVQPEPEHKDEVPPSDESLKAQADRAYREALAAGRTPRPRSPSPVPAPPAEETTTCLRIGKTPESSVQPSSKPSTEAALSAGELQRLEQMAAADRETLDQRRLLRTTPAFKPRT